METVRIGSSNIFEQVRDDTANVELLCKYYKISDNEYFPLIATYHKAYIPNSTGLTELVYIEPQLSIASRYCVYNYRAATQSLNHFSPGGLQKLEYKTLPKNHTYLIGTGSILVETQFTTHQPRTFRPLMLLCLKPKATRRPTHTELPLSECVLLVDNAFETDFPMLYKNIKKNYIDKVKSKVDVMYTSRIRDLCYKPFVDLVPHLENIEDMDRESDQINEALSDFYKIPKPVVVPKPMVAAGRMLVQRGVVKVKVTKPPTYVMGGDPFGIGTVDFGSITTSSVIEVRGRQSGGVAALREYLDRRLIAQLENYVQAVSRRTAAINTGTGIQEQLEQLDQDRQAMPGYRPFQILSSAEGYEEIIQAMREAGLRLGTQIVPGTSGELTTPDMSQVSQSMPQEEVVHEEEDDDYPYDEDEGDYDDEDTERLEREGLEQLWRESQGEDATEEIRERPASQALTEYVLQGTESRNAPEEEITRSSQPRPMDINIELSTEARRLANTPGLTEAQRQQIAVMERRVLEADNPPPPTPPPSAPLSETEAETIERLERELEEQSRAAMERGHRLAEQAFIPRALRDTD